MVIHLMAQRKAFAHELSAALRVNSNSLGISRYCPFPKYSRQMTKKPGGGNHKRWI